MSKKKYSMISGVLLHPLTVGGRALILYEGRQIWTSTVVAIHSVSTEQTIFETQNTFYILLKPAAPQTAEIPLPAMAAA